MGHHAVSLSLYLCLPPYQEKHKRLPLLGKSGCPDIGPTEEQAQGLYRLCYRLTNAIYPGWQYKSIELVRLDERSGNLYVLAGENLDFEIKPTGEYEP